MTPSLRSKVTISLHWIRPWESWSAFGSNPGRWGDEAEDMIPQGQSTRPCSLRCVWELNCRPSTVVPRLTSKHLYDAMLGMKTIGKGACGTWRKDKRMDDLGKLWQPQQTSLNNVGKYNWCISTSCTSLRCHSLYRDTLRLGSSQLRSTISRTADSKCPRKSTVPWGYAPVQDAKAALIREN